MTIHNDSQAIKSTDIEDGEYVSILVAGAAAASSVTTEHLFGTVMAATPKALRLQLEPVRGNPRSLWLPRRALTHVARDRAGVRSTIARWWKPDERQSSILRGCVHVSHTA